MNKYITYLLYFSNLSELETKVNEKLKRKVRPSDVLNINITDYYQSTKGYKYKALVTLWFDKSLIEESRPISEMNTHTDYSDEQLIPDDNGELFIDESMQDLM